MKTPQEQLNMFDALKQAHQRLVDKIAFERAMIDLIGERKLYDSTGDKLRAALQQKDETGEPT